MRTWRDYNYFLLGCVIVLVGFSLALVHTTTLRDPSTQGYLSRHLINMIVGGVAMLLITALDYHALEAWAPPLYLVMIAALGAVMAAGHVRGGAQSWLNLGVRTFQPSEPAKLLLIIVLAAYWSHNEANSGSFKVQLGGLLLAGIPIGLIFLQPDFGTAMVFVVIWAAMAWTAGLRWWQIGLLLIVAVPAAVLLWTELLDPYQKTRLLIFVDPLRYDPTLENGAWDVMQSLSAIGSGGVTGRGWTHGLITQGRYISALYSDFIFAAAGEELGFIGATVLILFECILMWQGFSIAQIARDSFGRLLCVGVTAMFLCHVLINVGMNMSIMPVTGIPLPFISYGGSFTLTTLAAIGLLESVALRRRRIVFG